MRGTVLTEPCSPYNWRDWPEDDPVNIWRIIDRLTDGERRRLVMAFAVHAPAAFEDKLLRLWAERA